MNPLIGKIASLIGMVSALIIRVRYARRSIAVPVAKSYVDKGEAVLTRLNAFTFLVLPLIGTFTSLFSFADRTSGTITFIIGLSFEVAAIVLLCLAHRELGVQLSNTLELKEEHQLVSTGVYHLVRHPMYLALFLYGIGQSLLFPNWVAGPAYLVTFSAVFFYRIEKEERMLRESFREEYDVYREQTKRLIPYVW